MDDISKSPLGKNVGYINNYQPELLCPIPRDEKRREINYIENIQGFDLWTAYELSWLKPNSLPQRKCITIEYRSDSFSIIESKSLKLYLNSFNQLIQKNESELFRTISRDINSNIKQEVKIRENTNYQISFSGIKNIRLLEENTDINNFKYSYDNTLLKSSSNNKLLTGTKLFKSNCLVTGQPDWATVYISIKGESTIEKNSLLRYLISFRNHNEFHEQCVERITCDLFRACKASDITVYARFTRRGGLDINPIRWIGNVDETIWSYYLENRELLAREFEQ